MTDDHDTATVQFRAPRNKTNWIGLIRTAEGTEVPCTVKDISKTGAKISVPWHIELPDEFMLKIIGMDYVCAVRLAWRAGNLAGLQIRQLAKLAPKPVDPPTPAERAEVADRTPHQSLGTRRGRPRD